jgi:toxin FitB
MGERVRAILDTGVVIATDVEPLDGELAISAITLAELHFGVLVAQHTSVRAERLRRLLALQRTFDALPLDEAVAASYGQVAAAVVDAGTKPRARDRWTCSSRPPRTPIPPGSTRATATISRASPTWLTSSQCEPGRVAAPQPFPGCGWCRSGTG